MPSVPPTYAVIDLDVIAANLRAIRTAIGPAVRLLVVVKADAYGHGMIEVAAVAEAEGADMLGVSNPDEGRVLRRAGITAPALILGASLPEQASAIIDDDLIPMVCTVELAEALAARARAAGRIAPVHIKIDTGMGRLGVPVDVALPFVRQVSQIEALRLDGIFTHFSSADDADKSETRKQIASFSALLGELQNAGLRPTIAHAANSAAVLDYPESYLDMVRPGLIVYGYYPSPNTSRRIAVSPSLTWKTRIVHVKRVPAGTGLSYGRTYETARDAHIATLPVGYNDGYARSLSNRGVALIHGKHAPVVGRVCMDQILVDVSAIPQAVIGDEATLIGRQGDGSITVEGLAEQLDTIPHEVICRIGKRVPRLYIRDGIRLD